MKKTEKLLLTAAAGTLTGRVVNEGLERRKQETKTDKSASEVIDEFAKGGPIIRDADFDRLVVQFKALAVECERQFPDIDLAGKLLDDIEAVRDVNKNRRSASSHMLELRREFMESLISNMRRFLVGNRNATEETKAEVKEELAHFQDKMEDMRPNKNIEAEYQRQILERLFNFTADFENRKLDKDPFYASGNKIKLKGVIPDDYLDYFTFLDETVANYSVMGNGMEKDESYIAEQANKLNEILSKIQEFKPKAGYNPHIGMLVELAQDPKNAEKYRLELLGTELGKELLKS